MRLLVHASGFKRPSYYRTDADELRCGKEKVVGGNPDCHWSPSSVDLEPLGRSSGGSSPAATIADLLSIIRRQSTGSIEELRILGHSNEDYFALGGEIVPDNVKFDEPTMLGQSASFISAMPRFRELFDRFAPHAQLTLVGCGSGGTGGTLLDLVSRTLVLRVAGFKKPIQYAIDGVPSLKPSRRVRLSNGQEDWVIKADAKITQRGKVMYSHAALQIEDVLGAAAVTRDALGTNAWDLKPDVESRAGVLIWDAAFRVRQGGIHATISAWEVGWRLISEFHSARGDSVAGVGYEENTAGLHVTYQGSKAFVNVGKKFVEMTNPATLEQRAREMGEALDLIANRKTGVVSIKP
jgi:hypothetical protein